MKESRTSKYTRKDRPASSPEAREQQMIAKAIGLAEKKLEDGTASSQIIVHYLKLATDRERIEREILEQKKELMIAQTEAIQLQKQVIELIGEAKDAFLAYSGESYEEDV